MTLVLEIGKVENIFLYLRCFIAQIFYFLTKINLDFMWRKIYEKSNRGWLQ
jgi:hypothetical protein